MMGALLILIVCEFIGETVRTAFSLGVPGPVIGMFLLAAILAIRKDKPGRLAIPAELGTAAETLIGHMGLLFVPAGVGIVAEAGLLRQEWLPILAGLVGSTILSLAVTGLVMRWTTRRAADTPPLRVASPVMLGGANANGSGS
jgi:holin-like protein